MITLFDPVTDVLIGLAAGLVFSVAAFGPEFLIVGVEKLKNLRLW
jgi:hypothetical protein